MDNRGEYADSYYATSAYLEGESPLVETARYPSTHSAACVAVITSLELLPLPALFSG